MERVKPSRHIILRWIQFHFVLLNQTAYSHITTGTILTYKHTIEFIYIYIERERQRQTARSTNRETFVSFNTIDFKISMHIIHIFEKHQALECSSDIFSSSICHFTKSYSFLHSFIHSYHFDTTKTTRYIQYEHKVRMKDNIIATEQQEHHHHHQHQQH